MASRDSTTPSQSVGVADIPAHPFIQLDPSNNTLVIKLDFSLPDPSPEETLMDQMIEIIDILPKYRTRTRSIILDTTWKPFTEDDLSLGPARETVMNHIVQEINNFANATELKVSCCGDMIRWRQFKPLLTLYGLRIRRWSFVMAVNGNQWKFSSHTFYRRFHASVVGEESRISDRSGEE